MAKSSTPETTFERFVTERTELVAVGWVGLGWVDVAVNNNWYW